MRNIRVLCADDNQDVLATLRFVLKRASDIECVGCLTSVRDLAAEVQRLAPDVLLLDFSIPGENSMAALSSLMHAAASASNLPANLPACIVLSGFDDTDIASEALAAGATRCLRKDLDMADILSAIREAVPNLDAPGAPAITVQPLTRPAPRSVDSQPA